MKLSAPKTITFWIAVIIAAAGVIASFVAIPVLSSFALWVVVLGFVVLALGNAMKGM